MKYQKSQNRTPITSIKFTLYTALLCAVFLAIGAKGRPPWDNNKTIATARSGQHYDVTNEKEHSQHQFSDNMPSTNFQTIYPRQKLVLEKIGAGRLFAKPLHPYTQGLLKSLPRLGFSGRRLRTISGTVPEPLHFPSGCKFHPRCPIGCEDRRCQTVEPKLREVEAGRCVACWLAPGYEKNSKIKMQKSKLHIKM